MAYALGNAEGIAPIQKAIEAACNGLQAACVAFSNFPPSDDRSFQAAGIPAVSKASASIITEEIKQSLEIVYQENDAM